MASSRIPRARRRTALIVVFNDSTTPPPAVLAHDGTGSKELLPADLVECGGGVLQDVEFIEDDHRLRQHARHGVPEHLPMHEIRQDGIDFCAFPRWISSAPR